MAIIPNSIYWRETKRRRVDWPTILRRSSSGSNNIICVNSPYLSLLVKDPIDTRQRRSQDGLERRLLDREGNSNDMRRCPDQEKQGKWSRRLTVRNWHVSSQESLVWLRDVRTRALLWTKEWCLQISIRAGGLRKPKQGLGGDRATANVAVGCHCRCSMLFVSLCARSGPG